MGSSKKRMANLLIYLSDHSNDEGYFYLPSREDIGALLAVTTETASRIVAEFKRLSLLQTKSHMAQLDKAKLLDTIK
jgi:hypothetical protein